MAGIFLASLLESGARCLAPSQTSTINANFASRMTEPAKDKPTAWQPWIMALVLVAVGAVPNVAAHFGAFDDKSGIAQVLLAAADLISLCGLIWIVFLFQRATYPPKK
jgi:hypothetical protein